MFQKPTDEQLTNRYMPHAPEGDQGERHKAVRLKVLETAKLIRDVTPAAPSRPGR